MDQEKVKKSIEENVDVVEFGEFGKGVSDYWINEAEKRLRVKFPSSYIWWLKNYSGGEINGDEIFSIYEIDFDSVIGGDIVYINELNRKNNLTKNQELVIQENDQGEFYYFDLSEINEDGESPIYVSESKKKYANNFFEFLIKKIEE